MRDIVRAEAWRGFRELVSELGGDPVEILAAARVDESDLIYPDRYLPLGSLVDSIEIAAKRLGRPDFGMLSAFRGGLSVLGALTLAASNSPTGREGWNVISRYVHIHNPALTVAITPVPATTCDLVSIDVRGRTYQASAQYLERGVAMVHQGLRLLCGSNYRPTEVWFRNDPLSKEHVYQKLFGVRPRFGMKKLGIVLERAILDADQPGRNADLRSLSETYLQSLGSLQDGGFSARVGAIVRGLLSNGECSSEQAARVLGLHERTLQRRLQIEDTSFEQIKDSVRKELAESMLAQPRVSLSHIAYVLNYAESSAFSRSARRWFGMSPSAYRARLIAGSKPSAPAVPRLGIKARKSAVQARDG